MKMKLLAVLIVAVLAAGMAQAADYDKGQMSNVRVYRVALGAGTAPSAADMAYNGVHNGDFVLNVSDNALYIMNASNVYVKITAAGAMTVAGAINGVTLNTSTVTNVLAAGSVLPAVDGSAVTNIVNAGIVSVSAAKLTAGTVATAIDGLAVTNLDLSKLASGKTAAAFNGSAVTSLTAANVGSVAAASAITNTWIKGDGTTNTVVLYPFGGGYIIKSISP